LTLRLLYIGKPRDPHANQIAQEFMKRAGRFSRVEMREIQPARLDPWTRYPAERKVLLDPAGQPLDSPRFTRLIGEAETSGRGLVFVVGGASGLPGGWRERAGLLLSLSALTLPHELARAVLAEQIYRALAALRGHPYPR